MRKFLFAVVFALAVPAVSRGQARPILITADEQSVRRFVEEFATALSSNDAATLDRLTAPDYTYVNQTGVIQNKTVRFAPIRAGELKYETVKYDQVQVHLFGNSAVVTTRVKVKARNRGMDASGMFRSTLTVVRGSLGWRLVASQSTTIAS